MSDVCDVCGEGKVQLKTEADPVKLQYLSCDTCGSEHTRAEHLRANKLAMLAHRERQSGAESV